MPQTADVFISYSREDKESVLSLTAKLREAGVSLWIDQGGIDGAAMWGEEIVNALENSKVLLLMVSERSVISHNVVKEVTLASERKSHILPIHLEPTRIPATLKYSLAGIQHIEYYQGDAGENLKQIVRSLERVGVAIHPSKQLANEREKPNSPLYGNKSDQVQEIPEAGIAVLPFQNASPDPDADYFSDGLTEELIASLSKVSELEVISRMNSVQYKDTKKDLSTVGHELRARYIVTGSVRKFQDNLRITAQLADAKTTKQLWSETYKGKLEDIFDIQEQVANQITEALKLKLTLTERVSLTKRSTVNAQAYDLYLRGKEYLYQLTKKSVEYSIQLFEKAIELDGRYAAAYGVCSTAYALLYTLFRREDKLKDIAQELGLKALMYDNYSADAYAALAQTYFYRKMNEEAISAGKRAMELDPDNFLAYWLVGRVYFSMGLYEEAVPPLERSLEMEANFYTTYNDLALTYKSLGREADSREMEKRELDFLPTHLLKYPDDGRARIFYATRLASTGKTEEAKLEAKKAMDLSPGDPLMLYNAACVFSQLGETKLAIQSLRDACATGYEYADWIKRDSDLDPIRSDPGYIELMRDK